MVDIYGFNLFTLVVLARKSPKELFKNISEGFYPIGEQFPMARKLCKELTLSNNKKRISEEFIIDHL